MSLGETCLIQLTSRVFVLCHIKALFTPVLRGRAAPVGNTSGLEAPPSQSRTAGIGKGHVGGLEVSRAAGGLCAIGGG